MRHLGNGPPHGSNAVYDDDGNLVILQGRQTDGTYGTRYFDSSGMATALAGDLGNGEHGFQVTNSNGKILYRVDDINGQFAPYVFAPMLPSGNNGVAISSVGAFRPGVTNTNMTELYRADFFATGNQVVYDVSMFPNSGNMSWQFKTYEVSTSNAQVVASGTETTNIQRAGTFTIPPAALASDGNSDVAGRYMTVRLEAQRNSGSATVDIAQNGPLYNHP